MAYEERFSREPLDAPWAKETERTYAGAIQRVLPPHSEVLSLTCRSRFCDLEIVHESAEVSNAFLSELFSMEREGSLDASSGGFHATPPLRMPDGHVTLHVYIVRRGQPIVLDPPETEDVSATGEAE